MNETAQEREVTEVKALESLVADVRAGVDTMVALERAQILDAEIKAERQAADEAARPQREYDEARERLSNTEREMAKIASAPAWQRDSAKARMEMQGLYKDAYDQRNEIAQAQETLRRAAYSDRLAIVANEYSAYYAQLSAKGVSNVTPAERQQLLALAAEKSKLENLQRFGRG
jgi:hypothetical protein